MASTSRPKKPTTGHAPISRNATPAAKLTTLTKAITTRKPVRLSERCGVSRAENNSASPLGSKSLPAVIAYQYILNMPKITRPAAKSKPAKKSRKPVAAKPKTLRGAKKLKPWTPAEVREAFERFRKANPEPKGE